MLLYENICVSFQVFGQTFAFLQFCNENDHIVIQLCAPEVIGTQFFMSNLI